MDGEVTVSQNECQQFAIGRYLRIPAAVARSGERRDFRGATAIQSGFTLFSAFQRVEIFCSSPATDEEQILNRLPFFQWKPDRVCVFGRVVRHTIDGEALFDPAHQNVTFTAHCQHFAVSGDGGTGGAVVGEVLQPENSQIFQGIPGHLFQLSCFSVQVPRVHLGLEEDVLSITGNAGGPHRIGFDIGPDLFKVPREIPLDQLTATVDGFDHEKVIVVDPDRRPMVLVGRGQLCPFLTGQIVEPDLARHRSFIALAGDACSPTGCKDLLSRRRKSRIGCSSQSDALWFMNDGVFSGESQGVEASSTALPGINTITGNQDRLFIRIPVAGAIGSTPPGQPLWFAAIHGDLPDIVTPFPSGGEEQLCATSIPTDTRIHRRVIRQSLGLATVRRGKPKISFPQESDLISIRRDLREKGPPHRFAPAGSEGGRGGGRGFDRIQEGEKPAGGQHGEQWQC